jgi:hypothetical protein
MQEVTITVRDGTEIGAAIYAPERAGRYPALLAASPYRYDNNVLPAGPQFLWRETGPIDFYVKQGYAYVHMDVRGSGRSGGEFEFLGPMSSATSTTSSNGSPRNPGPTAEWVASGSPTSACHSGGWESWRRPRSPASARTTA